MKLSLSLLFVVFAFSSIAQVTWKLPLKNKNVVYDKTFDIKDIPNSQVVSRVNKFVAQKGYSEPQTIVCRNKQPITLSLVSNNSAIKHSDDVDGIILGTAFFPFIFEKKAYLYVSFDFKIISENGNCNYVLDKFLVHEFIEPPKMKSTSWGGLMFGNPYIGGVTSSQESAKIKVYKLEDYLIRGIGRKDGYNNAFRNSPEYFKAQIDAFQDDLKTAILSKY